MKKNIQNKLTEIAERVYIKVAANNYQLEGGLYGGAFGILLFLFHYARYSQDTRFECLAEALTEKLLEQIDKIVYHAFSDGFSGVLYLFHFLREKGIIEIDLDETDTFLNSLLISRMNKEMVNKNTDFMHGNLGIPLYFLKRKIQEEQVSFYIDFLYNLSEKDSINKVFKWKSFYSIQKGITKPDEYNLSLSHGMASLILFFNKAIQSGVKSDKLIEMLEEGVHYFLSQRVDFQKYTCYFPKFANDNPQVALEKNRLAWCNGDLGIAWAIWEAGKITSRTEWKNIALQIFQDSAKRLTKEDSGVIDPWICHGSSGVAMFFRRIYLETGDPIFQEATNYWINQTLNQPLFEDRASLYKHSHFVDLSNEASDLDYTLLTGISGVGLLLISVLENDTQTWDELFLLS